MSLDCSTAGVVPAGASPARAFAAEVTPNSSLSANSLKAIVLGVGLVTFAVMAVSWHAGLWPISLFVGADALFLLAAVIGHRASLDRSQRITVKPGLIEIEHWRRATRVSREGIVPLGLVLERSDDPDHGCMALAIRVRDRRHVIAYDLSPPERSAFAEAFQKALDDSGISYRIARRTLPAYGWSHRVAAPEPTASATRLQPIPVEARAMRQSIEPMERRHD